MEQQVARRAHYPKVGGSSPPPATTLTDRTMAVKKLRWTDEALNSYGFWVLTSGIDMGRFEKNPIMLFNHHRTFLGKTDEILPIGKWQNWISDKNGVMTGEPVFDTKDAFAAKIAEKVEGDFLSACSIGIRIIEVSEDPEFLKPGQIRPTVIKCELREVSVVDIPSNPNAAGVVLYDANDKVISLTDGEDFGPLRLINNQNQIKMKQIALKLGLPETASEMEVLAKLSDQASHIATLTTERDKAVAELQKFKEEALAARKAEASSLVDAAVKEGRIDASQKDAYLKLFEVDHENTKAVLSSLPVRRPLNGRTASGDNTSYEKMSWDEIDKAGLLKDLKEKHPDLYQQKFDEMSSKLNMSR